LLILIKKQYLTEFCMRVTSSVLFCNPENNMISVLEGGGGGTSKAQNYPLSRSRMPLIDRECIYCVNGENSMDDVGEA
jgi:hypothetical protein